MELKFNWFKQDPIDYEHKQYVLLNYLKNVKEDLDNFKLYPAFQQISLHLANSTSILENDKFIFLKNGSKDVYDEILISDIGKRVIKVKESEKKEVEKIARFSKERFTQYFLLCKSIWTILYDSIDIEVISNEDNIKNFKTSRGFFFFDHDSTFFVYEFHIKRIEEKKPENKCFINKIYEGEVDDIKTIILDNSTLKPDFNVSREEIVLFYPIFKIKFENPDFPLEGGLLPLTRRKILNYIFQTVSMKELEENEESKEET